MKVTCSECKGSGKVDVEELGALQEVYEIVLRHPGLNPQQIHQRLQKAAAGFIPKDSSGVNVRLKRLIERGLIRREPKSDGYGYVYLATPK